MIADLALCWGSLCLSRGKRQLSLKAFPAEARKAVKDRESSSDRESSRGQSSLTASAAEATPGQHLVHK
jgi:hypothetical protein